MNEHYDWELIERLLHEAQNGANRPFAPPASLPCCWPCPAWPRPARSPCASSGWPAAGTCW
ncbi:hypothetical protein R0G64_32790, partial [Pseudomonas otitidis]|nr:hypothetical protein [Pseudomonas otitidis]